MNFQSLIVRPFCVNPMCSWDNPLSLLVSLVVFILLVLCLINFFFTKNGMLFYCTVNFLHIESKRNFILPVVFKVFSVWAVNIKVYNYWLGLRTTAVLFDPKTDMLPEVAGWGQQICLRVKQNCCCLRSQFETVFFIHLYFF